MRNVLTVFCYKSENKLSNQHFTVCVEEMFLAKNYVLFLYWKIQKDKVGAALGHSWLVDY